MDANDTRLPTPGAFTGEFQKIMEGAKDWKEVQDRLKGQTVTYFDFETTGIADYDGQDITNDPVQLGAVQVKDGKIVKRFNVYTNPESKLSEWSSKKLGRDILDEDGNRILDENGKPKTTLVTPEWLAEQASQEQALRDFIDFIGPNPLLGGQNVPFDVEILKRMADKYGIELDIAGTIDSKDLASLLPKYDPEKGIDGPKQIADVETGRMRPSSSLGPVANFLGFEPANWHSADGDAEDSYNLVSKIIDRAANEENQDLSLLDFPLMQKRYEERMAEFKAVVDPSNPTTDRQKKALEEFSNSDNPDIAQKAKDALASATTRGDAAEALADIHAQESLPSITVSESAAEGSQYNADESDPDFSSEVSENEGPSSQKLVMPEPEDGGSNKTIEAGTLFKKINSLKKMIENGEELQTYLKSRGKEEDPDMAKLLKMHYRELKGLEFIEAYRKQTGKDRVSAPWSVFDGTHPMFGLPSAPDANPTPDADAVSSHARLSPPKELKTVKDIFKYSKSKEVSDFVSSNFDYKETPENIDAVNIYVGDDDKTLDRNKNLREGLDASELEQLDAWTNSGTVSNPVRVYRGIVASDDVADSYRVGSTVSDKSFVSAAVNRQQAVVYQIAREQDGAKGKRITFMIDLDSGVPAGVATMGEIVLPRGTKFEVIGNRTLESGNRAITLRVKADSVKPAPDADEIPSLKPAKNEALDIDLSDFDFDDDGDGQIEPSEIAAAAKALAASAGHGMKLDGIKSAPVLATNGREVKIEGSSTLKAQAPSQQAIEVKNSVVSLGTALLDSAMQTVERKLKERGIPSDGTSIQDYIRELNKKDLAAVEAILDEVGEIKKNIVSMRDAEIDKLAATITDAQFQRYLAGRGIPKEFAETMSLDGQYRARYSEDSNDWYSSWKPDSIDPNGNKATPAFFKKALMFDAGNGFTYAFVRSNMPYDMTYRQRIAAILINDTKKLSDFPEISELASKVIALRKEAEKIKLNKFEGEYKAMVRDSIVDEMKKAGVEFDSVDMSSVVGGVLPVRRGNRDPSLVDVVTGYGGLDEKLKEELQKAFEYIPTDILLSGLKNLQDGKGKIGIKYSEARAHFYESRNGGIIRGNDADDFLHEFWHFFQAINPDIVVLEHAFIYDRLKDSNGNLPKTEKKDQYFQFLDGDFTSAYTTKQYPNKTDYFDFSPLNRATEVSTVGMQDLFTSPNDFSVNSDKWSGILYVTIGKGKEKKVYENPHMDIATGIWYSDESMTEMLPGQGERSSKVVVKGRRRDLGVDKEFRAFNIGLMLSLLDWSSK